MNELFKMMLFPTFAEMFANKEMDTIDLTTKEGHDKAIEILTEASENKFTKSLFGDEFLEGLIKNVNDIYEEANPTPKYSAGVAITKETEPVKPSTRCTQEQKDQITQLVDEYVDTIIQPVGKFDENVLKSVKNSLFEFSCWVIKH